MTLGDGRDDLVPLNRECPDLSGVQASQAGAGGASVITNRWQQDHSWRVSDGELRLGMALKLAEELIQIGLIVRERCTAAKVVANHPYRRQCRLVGECFR